MKKFVAVLSAAAMMTSLAACGSTADTANTAASSAEHHRVRCREHRGHRRR